MKDWIKELCPEIAEQFPWQAELIAAEAKNAVKAEREACAKVSEDYWSEGYCDDAVREIAAEIRARGEP